MSTPADCTCRLQTSPGSPEHLAARIAVLGLGLDLDYTLISPAELAPHLHRIAGRARFAVATGSAAVALTLLSALAWRALRVPGGRNEKRVRGIERTSHT
ncbi:hypothetical protein AB0H82_10180 [Streptomyces sp. NPDC050732]|uniref:hypothetical protein n=1 Tax=Streptomyces sp. NPDC050732 TaxID=3154632 RepID=UPI0034158E13